MAVKSVSVKTFSMKSKAMACLDSLTVTMHALSMKTMMTVADLHNLSMTKSMIDIADNIATMTT